MFSSFWRNELKGKIHSRAKVSFYCFSHIETTSQTFFMCNDWAELVQLNIESEIIERPSEVAGFHNQSPPLTMDWVASLGVCGY